MSLKLKNLVKFRSPVNPKLFLVQEKDGALESTLNQFDVLVEKPTDMLQVSQFFIRFTIQLQSNFFKPVPIELFFYQQTLTPKIIKQLIKMHLCC